MSQQPLSTLVPVENAAMPDRTIIQWDKNDLDSLGLLKVDCLALGMMSAIRRALRAQGPVRGTGVSHAGHSREDPATYDMLCKGESVGVFQVESRAQMTMLPRLKPRCYFDLVIEVAIIRPGPIQGGMVHPYLRRRQGLETVTYPNEALRKDPRHRPAACRCSRSRSWRSPWWRRASPPARLTRCAARWRPGSARGGLAEYRDKLIAGMLERGYTAEFAEQIYNQILGFGSYGFPQSHSASFALLVYASAWLRLPRSPRRWRRDFSTAGRWDSTHRLSW